MSKTYNNSVTIVKAIGIILMVIGHSGCPILMENFIYLFHMPLFFFCSGLFFTPIVTKEQNWIFVKKKIKGLYLPFLKWCVCFLLLHNVFMIIGVYNQTYGYLGGSSYYTINDYLQKLFYIVFTMHDYEYLLGGFWFIRSLVVAILLISIFFFFIRKEFMYKYILFCVFFLGVTIIIRKYCPKTELARDVSLGALGASFYLFGYLYNKLSSYIRRKFVLIVCAIILLGAMYSYSDGITMNCTYNMVFLYFLTGISGIQLTFYVSRIIDCSKWRCKQWLYYIGNNTLVILALHFLSFKLISLAIVILYNMELIHIAEHPVIDCDLRYHETWWILYSIVGIVVPLILLNGWQRLSLWLRNLVAK